MLRSLLLVPLLAMTACQKSEDQGASVTFNASGGEVRGALGGDTGGIKVDLPGLKGELKLPKIDLDADNFELNGVHLYPGSKIETIDIRGDQGGLKLRFDSPETPATVRDWFLERLEKAGFRLSADGDALVGTDDDGKPFRMELTPDGDGAKGTIAIGG